ncbi:MAG TPA: PIN domain-containing protein [Ramlibacter sp.]|uniref:type II toxin-antitoxin system VapC family toxin n=1 Tax=Ramlibacter sp. TaxID=1917967 RepID=UPI002C7836FC|nr:PIN domain-containing protein [Ramlibacter sp.]HVZ46269.1 PIN domain-containing protein [Ramlibacter sp.]
MASGRPQFYWDTACLIAWIKDETRADPAEMAGLAEVIDMVDRGKAIIITSVLWRAEVLNGDMTPAQRKRLDEAFDPRALVELDINGRVMALAGEIRDFQRNSKKKDVMKNIRVPDAIHLASAIYYEATEFHTFDGASAGSQKGKLLTLDGNVAGHRLKICTPKAEQLRLEFPLADSQSDISE